MNERIFELAEQAGIVFWEMSGDVDWRQANRENLEKFAELIVKECMGICEQQRVKILNNPNDPSWTEHLAECQTIMEQTFLRS